MVDNNNNGKFIAERASLERPLDFIGEDYP